VAILTDSAACVPPALAQEYGIEIVPFQLIWDGEVYLDGQGLTPAEFYRRFRASSTYPTTATPTLGQFIAAFQRAAEHAEGVVGIFVSEALTSTVRLARQAAQELNIPVYILDSRNGATTEGFIALAAARAARRGASLEEVVAVAGPAASGWACSLPWKCWSTCVAAGASVGRPRSSARACASSPC